MRVNIPETCVCLQICFRSVWHLCLVSAFSPRFWNVIWDKKPLHFPKLLGFLYLRPRMVPPPTSKLQWWCDMYPATWQLRWPASCTERVTLKMINARALKNVYISPLPFSKELHFFNAGKPLVYVMYSQEVFFCAVWDVTQLEKCTTAHIIITISRKHCRILPSSSSTVSWCRRQIHEVKHQSRLLHYW